ncbi:hypothetical protein BpHYR1_024081 [Brachionus plicatilis]|uniref:Uncharacterized protein n=1 Tax=Brachionus plicatilis TaxID=10195 RepID=A0A3M7R750_BRAPC|nr:hypothetical protein BpHYR1_024081 [Brachionus plicatilis]
MPTVASEIAPYGTPHTKSKSIKNTNNLGYETNSRRSKYTGDFNPLLRLLAIGDLILGFFNTEELQNKFRENFLDNLNEIMALNCKKDFEKYLEIKDHYLINRFLKLKIRKIKNGIFLGIFVFTFHIALLF